MTISARRIGSLLLFAAMVLSAGVARGQDTVEDFPTFVAKYTGDCQFRESRTVSPILVTVHNYEDTNTVTVIDKSDGTDRWHTFVCSDLREFFPKYTVSVTTCIEDQSDYEECFSATVEDTGILIEFRFVLVAGKYFLKQIDDYSM